MKATAGARGIEPWAAVRDVVVEALADQPLEDDELTSLRAVLGLTRIKGRSADDRRQKVVADSELLVGYTRDMLLTSERKAIERLAAILMRKEEALPASSDNKLWWSHTYHPPGQLHNLAHIERVRLGPDGRIMENEGEALFQVNRDGVSRFSLISKPPPGNEAVQPVLLEGGSYDRVVTLRNELGEIRHGFKLERELNTGDVFRARWKSVLEDDSPQPFLASMYMTKVAFFLVEVYFHHKRLPKAVYAAEGPVSDWLPSARFKQEVVLDPDQCARFTFRDLNWPDGIAGLTWEW